MSLSVWFVCRLCRGSFGQVDAFIEHKKEKHFTQFQNITSIVFEESEHGLLYPAVTNDGDPQLADEIIDPLIKTEVMDNDPNNPSSSEIIGDLNFGLVELKPELITYESEIIAVNEENFFALEQPEHNPYVLLKRLTSEEIQSACVPQHNVRFSTFKQENLASSSEFRDTFDADGIIIDHNEVKNEKSTKNELPASVRNIATEDDRQFECKLCSKQLESDGQLKIHVGICALYHKDRKRFCVLCNQKFSYTHSYRGHHLRIHGTEEEKLSLYKFKCHLCSKQYCHPAPFSLHLETHKEKKQKVEKTSKPNIRKCSHPNCGKRFPDYSHLQRHISSVHLGARPFSCSFPNCNKTFKEKHHMERHFMIHTGERPFKCTVKNCSKAFRTSQEMLIHQRTLHRHT